MPQMTKIFTNLQKFLLGVSLRIKILGLALGLIGAFSFVTIFYVNQEIKIQIDTLLYRESKLIASELSYQARDLLLINDSYGLTRLLKNAIETRPDIRYAFILDHGKHVLAHTFGRDFPLDLLSVGPNGNGNPEEQTLKIVTNEGPIWDTQQLVMPGSDTFIRVGVKGDKLQKQLSTLIGVLVRTTILLAVYGAVLSFFLSWVISRPVKQLLEATQKIRRGSYDFALEKSSDDEIGSLVESFNDMARSLQLGRKAQTEKDQLQRDFLQKIMAAQENERRRISRELHDQTGQALASFMLELRALDQALSEKDRKAAISRLKQAIANEMETLHSLAVELRPRVLDELGLVPAIEMYVQNFEKRHGIQTTLTILGTADVRVDPCLETCVYRIVQEGLTNIAKHSKATKASVFLDWRKQTIRGGIEDNGEGFVPENIDVANQMGIYGIRERAQLLNGNLNIDSGPEIGTMISFEIPLKVDTCHE